MVVSCLDLPKLREVNSLTPSDLQSPSHGKRTPGSCCLLISSSQHGSHMGDESYGLSLVLRSYLLDLG